ncbi:hypothetical protein BDN71DRAFT_1436928 [Pleurotus eryngii]|uniref:Uncharacterized protein n=1 Tax=Pleurotus eryngii TaxID=5323 RepID=A0A9P5ZH33_PLEER|nr:hypothetical protein BDN71DRAFT_1436928 [Pleurotus eryngii]
MKLMNEFLKSQKKGRLDKFWYLKCWYYNHNKPKHVLPFGHIVKKALQGKKAKRRPQLTEVYCHLFYKERILHHVKAKVNRLTTLHGKKPTHGMKLQLVCNYAITLLDLEPAEIKNKVEGEYERYKEEVEKIQKEATMTPQAYAEAIDTIGAHFDAFSKVLGEITGWKFTLLAGGLNPMNGGRIRTIAVHHGENHAGLSFGEADVKSAMGAAFGSFLQAVYTPSECAARSLYPEGAVQGASSPSVQSDNMAGTPAVDLPPPIPIDNANLWAALSPLEGRHVKSTLDAIFDPTSRSLNEDFDPLDENIDWDSLRLFDPRNMEELGAGMLGGGSGLFLTDKLAAPLPDHVLSGFGFITPNINAATHLGATVSSQASAMVNQIQPATPNTPISSQASTTVDPIQPATPNTAVSSQASATVKPNPIQQAASNADRAPVQPFDDVENLSTTTGAPVVPQNPASQVSPTGDGAPESSVTGDGPPTNPDAVLNTATGITGSVLSKSTDAPPQRNKQSRDPIDAALIVPGKQSRKAKDCPNAEVQPAKPKGKENCTSRH